MANLKFKLTNETKVIFGRTLFRLEATASFGNVKKGEKGGWVEKEDNLSQDGNAWVSGNAWVYGNARVSGDAEVYGNARVYGNAKLSLKKAFTKGFFLHSSDSTITPTIIDQSKEEGFDSSDDYKYLLVVGDYEIEDIDPKPEENTDTIEIVGKTYEVSDELKEALKDLKEV